MKITQGLVASVSIGGVTLPAGNSVVLTANTTASGFDTFRKNASAYQVPTGKKLIIRALRVSNQAAVGMQISLGYGTGTVTNSVSAPTGNVSLGAGGASNYVPGLTGATAGNYFEIPEYKEIPAGMYPYFAGASGGGAAVIALGELVDV